MTIGEAAEALRLRRVSSVELTKQCLDKIAKLNPALNAFLTVTADSALARAEELDRELARGIDRGPLHGIPIAHKDLMYTKGVRTTSGSKLFGDFVPDRDAAVVQKLAEAGAVMVGKAGLHELAYGITSDNPHFGTIRTHAIRSIRRVDRAVDRAWRWLLGWRSLPRAPTQADRFACPRRSAGL